MKLVDLSCPHCGAHLKVDSSKRQVYCEHCGAALLVDDEVQHIQYDNAEEAGYKFEKGRQRAQAEASRAKNSAVYSGGKPTPQKKRRTWLWVLGWIFIFPLPLTILLLRKKNMKAVIKYPIIAVAWLLYLLFVFAGQSSNESKPANSTTTTPVAQSSDATSSAPNNAPEENSQVDTDAENLKQVFLALSPETQRDDVDALAKQYGMYSSNRNTGTGTYVYRIAASKDVASVNTKAKGSFVVPTPIREF